MKKEKEVPFISIIVPIYNVEKYLRHCLDVLLAESFRDYEIILVDDGSPDGCPQICDEYAGENEKIRVIHKANGGLSSARNEGMEIARGSYLFFLDSDDYLAAGALQTIADVLMKKPADILKFNHIRMPSGEKIRSTLEPGFYGLQEIRTKVLPLMLNPEGGFVLSAWSHIYRREFLGKNQLHFVSEREIGSEDYLFNFQVFQKAESLLVVTDCLYHYVFRKGSLSCRYKENMIGQYRKLYLAMKESVRENKLQEHAAELDRFYVWTCYYVLISNECSVDHEKNEALTKIRGLLRQKELREALHSVIPGREPRNRQVIYLLLKYRCAYGLWQLKTARQRREQKARTGAEK